ncbi:MAG: hypothetical protein U0231_20670 [Nitrospiraceae bacterium]
MITLLSLGLQTSLVLLGLLTSLYGPIPLADAQVFPPRSNTPSVPVQPVPPPMGQQMPGPNQMPPIPGQRQQGIPGAGMQPMMQPPQAPAPLVKTIPLALLLGGDLSKSFVQLTNLRGQVDSNFTIGRSLAGRFTVPPYVHEASNGSRVFVHANGLSNPPVVKSEGNELHLEFHFPSLQFKTYYRDYSPEGDQAVGDTVGENAIVDIFILPTTNQQGFPTYQAVRAGFRGTLKPQDKCTYWFDVIFPINICEVSKKYLDTLGNAIETGVREALSHPQTRTQFDQIVWQTLRADLLMQAGINPMSPAQIQVLEASFHGTDYVVKYLPR